MTTLIRVDFKERKVVGRHQLAELAEPVGITYRCVCCQQVYSSDKESVNYSESVTWEVRTKSGKVNTNYLCKHCIDDAYRYLNGGDNDE